MTLFSGNLDIGKIALKPGCGSLGCGLSGQSARAIGKNAARIAASRKARGNSPVIPNKATHPSDY